MPDLLTGDLFSADADLVALPIDGAGPAAWRDALGVAFDHAVADAKASKACAMIVRDDGTLRDTFGELGSFVNLAGTSSADTVAVAADGASCGEAVVRVEGDYVLSDYVNLATGIDIVLPGALSDVDVDAP